MKLGIRQKLSRLPLILLCLLVILAAGCGKTASGGTAQSEENSGLVLLEDKSGQEKTSPGGAGDGSGQEETSPEEYDSDSRESEDFPDSETDGISAGGEETAGEDFYREDAPEQESLLAQDGSYTEAEDVALYLHLYGELPRNFMTKKEAQALGWEGGSLEKYAPGMCIGGDVFRNYEGTLPDGRYHECDIGTLGRKSRGARRLVFDDRGNIYYTDDHYETFTLLYEGD